MELRKYQKEAAGAILEFFENGRMKDFPIVVAPTGAGKSVLIAYVAKQLKEGVLILQPSKELLEQNFGKFEMYGGEASVYSASMKQKEVGEVTFATIGSIKKCPELFAHVKYILIDECHLVPPNDASMFMNFIKSLSGVKVVGLTATAFRLKKYRDPFSNGTYSQINLLPRERPHFFNRFLYITQIKELCEAGFLSVIRYIEMGWENGQLKCNTTGAEFSDESIEKALKQQKVYERMPNVIKQSIEKGRKFRIVFVNSVAVAEELAKKIPNSACVHSGTKPKEREEILSDFRLGVIKTVFNVGVLTVGFDFPALDTIIIARPTMSLALYMQMIGRGVRPHSDKKDCVILDMCGNIQRFSKIEDIEYVESKEKGWVLHDGKKQLSGVPLSEII